MMTAYIIRYAHLRYASPLEDYQIVTPGTVIGEMGGSPYTDTKKEKPYYSPHLHIDCRKIKEGEKIKDKIQLWRLSQTPRMENCVNLDSKKQLDNVVQRGPFSFVPSAPCQQGEFLVTTRYLCPVYKEQYGVPHPAYDLIPDTTHKKNKPPLIYWSGDCTARVITTGYDQPAGRGGYGYYALLEIEKET